MADEDFAGGTLEQRLALIERQLLVLLGEVHDLREGVEDDVDDGHIDP